MADELAPNERFEWDTSVIGVEVEVGTYTVTREQILAYVEALGETNPLYQDETAARARGYRDIIAPPMFYSVFRTAGGLDPKVIYGDSGFDAGRHCEFVAPIQAGDTITAKTKIADVYPKTGRSGTMVFTVRETSYYNQDGRMVVRAQSTNVRRFVQRGD